MFNGNRDCHGNFGHCGNGLTSGRPILYAEDQFLACHFNPSQFVPFRKIGRQQLKEILRRAATSTSDTSDIERSFKDHNKEKAARIDEFEMISLYDNFNEEELSEKSVHRQQQEAKEQEKQKHFCELLHWISQEGKEFVHVETFKDLKEVFALMDAIARSRKPLLTTILIRETEQSLVTVSLSSVKVDVHCLLFCMFQT